MGSSPPAPLYNLANGNDGGVNICGRTSQCRCSICSILTSAFRPGFSGSSYRRQQPSGILVIDDGTGRARYGCRNIDCTVPTRPPNEKPPIPAADMVVRIRKVRAERFTVAP